MPTKLRVPTRDRERAWRLKRGIVRKVRFPKRKISGEIIYQNPNAVPVPKKIAKTGERKPFTLENVEWISVREPLPYKKRGGFVPFIGGFGELFWGRIKFKGKTGSEKVVIKKYKEYQPSSGMFGLKDIMQALKKSGVPHPKMEYFEIGEQQYVVMEPFLRNEQGKIMSKFAMRKPFEDLIRLLDLRKTEDCETFRQAMEYTARLAKAGLALSRTEDNFGPRADVFNQIVLTGEKRKGEGKVFVEDFDTFYLYPDKKRNWGSSAKILLEVVTHFRKRNSETAKRIMNEIARRHKLPEISVKPAGKKNLH